MLTRWWTRGMRARESDLCLRKISKEVDRTDLQTRRENGAALCAIRGVARRRAASRGSALTMFATRARMCTETCVNRIHLRPSDAMERGSPASPPNVEPTPLEGSNRAPVGALLYVAMCSCVHGYTFCAILI